jgi:hypothetical protein
MFFSRKDQKDEAFETAIRTSWKEVGQKRYCRLTAQARGKKGYFPENIVFSRAKEG